MPEYWIIFWAVFHSHLIVSGPGVPYTNPCSADMDFDADGDVDLKDLAVFQIGYRCLYPDPPLENICGCIYKEVAQEVP